MKIRVTADSGNNASQEIIRDIFKVLVCSGGRAFCPLNILYHKYPFKMKKKERLSQA